MAFPNPPKTWTAAAVLTAAQLNAELRDALNALLPLNLVAWTSYTPTLTQTGAVTKTVTYAKYTRFGNMVAVTVYLTCTGAGTANATISISLPVTAASANTIAIGTGVIFTATNTPGVVYRNSTTTMAMLDATQATSASLGQTGSAFAGALASTNVVAMSGIYEV